MKITNDTKIYCCFPERIFNAEGELTYCVEGNGGLIVLRDEAADMNDFMEIRELAGYGNEEYEHNQFYLNEMGDIDKDFSEYNTEEINPLYYVVKNGDLPTPFESDDIPEYSSYK